MDAPIAPIVIPTPPLRPSEIVRVQPVAPAESSGRAGRDRSPFAPAADDAVTRRQNSQSSFAKDDSTGAMVYRLIDLSSGIVTIQTPSDARLKLRAYIDGVIAADAQPAVEVTG